MKKKQIIMNKPVFLRPSILELFKIVMYEFWYNYVKPKYGEKKPKQCHMDDTAYIKTEDIYLDIAEDVDTGHDTSNYKL